MAYPKAHRSSAKKSFITRFYYLRLNYEMVVLDSSWDLMVRKKVCFNLYYDQAVSWGAEVQVDEISRFICATSLKNNIRLPR